MVLILIQWENTNNPGTEIANTQTYTATQIGTYIVKKVSTSGCDNSTETINVVDYNTVPNPLIDFADQVVNCLNPVSDLVEIYLCGAGDSRYINLPFTGATATTVKWFQLDETKPCDLTKPTDLPLKNNCPNIATDCSWDEIVPTTPFSMSFATAGQYKIEVLYDGQCPSTYYFNVFTGSLTPIIDKENIVCNTNGSITVNSVPAGYEYSLTGPAGYNAPFQDLNSFTNLTEPGDYDLIIRLKGSTSAACSFPFSNINIQKQALGLTVAPIINMECEGGVAKIIGQLNGDAPGPFTYTLINSATGLTVATLPSTTDKDFSFDVTDDGLYVVKATTADCSEESITNVVEPDPLFVTASITKNITCLNGSSAGVITLTGAGGTIDTAAGETYTYAVWSKDGTPLYADVASIPIAAYSSTNPLFTTNNTYSVPNGSEGKYVFVIIDSNDCPSFSNEVEIIIEAPLTFTHTETPVNCNDKGITNAQVVDDFGYAIEYSINNTDWFASGVFNNLDATTPSTLYTVYIRATKGGAQCLYEIPDIEITETEALYAEASQTQDYTRAQDGTITFDITKTTGGTPPYTYGINGDFTTDPIKIGLTNIAYTLVIKDKNNCEFILPGITIPNLPTAPTLGSSIALNCDTTATVTITPFNANYIYKLGALEQTGNNIFYNVPDGAHNFIVDYGSSCTTDINVTVNGTQFEASFISKEDSDCYGSDNGAITIDAKNFYDGRYEYSTDNGTTWEETGDNPYRIVGLPKGDYHVLIREVTGIAPNQVTCPVDLGIIKIGEPPVLELTSATVTTQATCTENATITVVADGGVPPYKFSIDNGITWQDSVSDQYIYTNIAPSATNYKILLLDSRRCDQCGCTVNPFENGGFEDHPEKSATGNGYLIRDESQIPGWDTTEPENNEIEIWYNSFQGVPPYEGTSFAELNANKVGALYQEFCTKPGDVISWSVVHRGRSGVDVATVKIGGSLATGTIKATMSDDNTAWGQYSSGATPYIVPAGQTTTVIAFEAVSSTGGDSYGNFIDDVKIEINRVVCTPVEVEVKAAEDVVHTASITNNCYNGSNAEIVVNVTDGNGKYQFSIDGGTTWETPTDVDATTFTFDETNGLNPPTTISKTYTIDVKDSSGCVSPQTSHLIYPQLKLTTTSVNETCKTGQITITPEGGDTNYIFAVIPTGNTVADADFSTTNPIDVAAGIYDVYVRDKNGGTDFCQVSEIAVKITKIDNPTVAVTVTQPKCFGETGTIDLDISNGIAPFKYTLDGGTPQDIIGNQQSISGLNDGNHTIVIIDANDCSSINIIENISVPAALENGKAVATDFACSASGTISGTITFSEVIGGTTDYIYSYKLTSDTVYTPLLAGETSVSNIAAGTYDTQVTDAEDCVRALNLVEIKGLPTEPTLASGVTYNCDGTGNIKVTATPAAVLPIIYSYTLGAETNTTGVFEDVSVGTHTVSVAYGSNCFVTINEEVKADQKFTAAITDETNPVCIGESNGEIEVTVSFPSITPATFEYFNGIIWVATTSNPFTISGFNGGVNHEIKVRPLGATTASCDVILNKTLTNPSAVIVDPLTKVTKEITCTPATGATITPLASGGNGAVYTFELFNDAGVSQGDVFTDLSAGDYTIIATDSKLCTSVPFPITVAVKEDIAFELTPELCYSGANDGTIKVIVTGGNGNYTFSRDNGVTVYTPNPATPNEYTFTGLSDTVYNITVTDKFACELTKSATILPELEVSAITTNESCKSGDLTITATGGDGDYVYAVVTSGAAATGFSVTKPITIAAGTWDIYVRDHKGTGTLGTDFCESKTTKIVTRIVDPTITTTATQPECSGETGTIKVVVANGTADYTVTVTGLLSAPVVQTGNLLNYEFTGLADDTYTISIEDANGCSQTPVATETIKVPSALAGGTATPVDFMCNTSGGTIQGGINFTNPTDGTPGYTFYYKLASAPITDFTPITGTTVTGLAAGIYDTKVLDANDCEIALNQVEIKGLPTTPVLVSAVTYNCDGTGNITITPLDASYTYTLDGNATTDNNTGVFNNVSQLTPHVITVAYGSSCTTDITVTLDTDKAFGATVTNTTNPLCFGASDGTITIEAVNATLPYQYSIDNGTNWKTASTNTFIIPALADGSYDIRVRQNAIAPLCDVAVSTETLNQPVKVTVTASVIQGITCNATGTEVGATIQAIGAKGIAPYTYELFDNTNTSLGSTLTGIGVGTYTIIATDKNGLGCPSDAVTVIVNPKENITFNLTPEYCYDGTNGTIVVAVTNGNGDYQINTNNGGWKSLTPTSITPLEYTITGLSNTPSPHSISVRDKSMCVVTDTVTINPELTAFATPTNISCNSGKIVITPNGGDGNYQYTISPSAGTTITGNEIAITTAATYTVTVQDKNGGANACSISLPNIVINDVPDVKIILTPNNPQCNGDLGSVDGVITAGTGEIEHTITLKDNLGTIITTLNNYTLPNFSFNSIPAGTDYEVEITDSLGCTDIKTFDLIELPPIVLNIEPILPANCEDVTLTNTGLDFNFGSLNLASYAPYTVEYTLDSNTNTGWTNMNTLTPSVSAAPHPTPGDNLYSVRGLIPGTLYRPAIRILNTDGTVRCQLNNGIFVMPYSVNGLKILIKIVPGDCTTGYTVTVEAIDGVGPFEFSLTPDPINPSTVPGFLTWYASEDPVLSGTNTNAVGSDYRRKIFTNIIPGVEYDFYVRDTSTTCIAEAQDQATEPTNTGFDVTITPTATNQSCPGAIDNGELSFLIEDTDTILDGKELNWQLYDGFTDVPLTGINGIIPNTTTYPFTLNTTAIPEPLLQGLSSGLYFIVIEDTSSGTFPNICKWGSKDVEILKGTPFTGNLNILRDITCNTGGQIRIENINGGFPNNTVPKYTYTVTAVGATATVDNNSGIVSVAYPSPVTATVDVAVTVTDSNGCSFVLNETINVSDNPTINSVTVNSCDAVNTIDINTTGGLAPYKYSLDGTNFTAPITTAIYTMNGIPDGVNQTLTVRDANGCENTYNFTVYPDITFDITNITIPDCMPANNATATITVNTGSGTGNYEYSLDSNLPAIAFAGTTLTLPANLNTGNHTIKIFDTLNSCSLEKTFTVSNTITPIFTANITKNNICDSATNGEITISPIVNGADPLSFTIRNITAGTPAVALPGLVISTLAAGEYEIVATGIANGCTFTYPSLTIIDLEPIVATTPTVTQFECDLGTNVENIATVTLPNSGVDLITGGTGNYSQVIFTYTPVTGPQEIQDSNSLTFTTTNTSGGTVAIQVFDDEGCSSNVVNATINEYIQLDDIQINIADAITCNRGERITANVTFIPLTATPVVIYSLLDSMGTELENNNDGNFTSFLVPGIYTVKVLNTVTNCSITKTHTVGDAPVYDLIAYNPVNETCNSDNNGQITFNFSTTSAIYASAYDYQLYDSSDTAIGGLVTGVTGEQTINNLSAGSYYVEAILTATSATGTACTIKTANFTINEALIPLSVTGLVTTEVNCINEANATITATVIGGWGNTIYQLENTSGIVTGYDFVTNGNNDVFNNLPAGNYTVRVRDGSGCEAPSTVIVVDNPTQVTFSITEDDTACDLSTGGTITVTASGGSGTYKYILTNSTGVEVENTGVFVVTAHTFTDLPAETYTISVLDANLCVGIPLVPSTNTVTINPDVNFSLNETKKVDCSVAPDGLVRVTLSSWTNGTSNYTYNVVGSVDGLLSTGVVVTSNPFTISIPSGNTTPQTYTVTVTDTDALPTSTRGISNTIEIQPRIEPDFAAIAIVDDICKNSLTGVVQVTAVANGITPLTYVINNVAGTFTATPVGTDFINLPADDYIVTATGINICTADVPVTIKENNIVDPSAAISVTEFACSTGTNKTNNAIVIIDKSSILGGSGTYTSVEFVFTPTGGTAETPIVSNSFVFNTDNISGGIVTITVSDDKGCSGTTTATIAALDGLTNPNISLDKAITCTTGEDITVTFDTVSGISADIKIEGINGNSYAAVTQNGTSGDFDNLPTGDYQITIVHPTTGCELITYHTVNPEPVYSIGVTNIVDISCKGGNDGSAVLDFSSNSPIYTLGYTYEVFMVGNPVAVANGIGTGGIPTLISNLVAADYYVTIDMGLNTPSCTAQTANFTISESAIALSVTGIVSTQVSCINGANATITATAIGGWGDNKYQLENTSGIVTGYDFATNGNNDVFNNLSSGSYTVRVRDSSGCEVVSTVILINNPTQVTFSVAKNDTACDLSTGGTITVTASGGSGTYKYILTNSTGVEVENTGVFIATSHTFTNLPTETYTVSVVDANLCIGIPDVTSNVIISPDLIFTVNETKKLDCSINPDASVVLDLLSGSGTYDYQITGPSAVVTRTLLTTKTLTFNPTTIGSYEVTVFDTGATPECSIMIPVTISSKIEPEFIAVATINNICNGDATGVIQMSQTNNGINPLSYTISPDPNTVGSITSDLFIDLPAATYTITATGNNSCSTSETVTISEKSIINIEPAITVTEFDCTVGNDTNLATITIDKSKIEGGIVTPTDVPSFEKAIFVYDNGTPTDLSDDIKQEGSSFNYTVLNEAGGTVTITVFDDAGCSDTTTRTILLFEKVTAADILVSKEIDCDTGENITVKTTENIANLIYTITGTATTVTQTETVILGADLATFTNLLVDKYVITIANPATGCVFSTEYIVNEVPTFVLNVNNINNVSCFGTPSGSAELIFSSIEEYNGNYTYEIFNVGGLTTTITGSGTGNVIEPLTGLESGDYYVTVKMTDSPFCDVSSAPFKVLESPGVLGVTTALSYISCVDPNSGEVVLQGTSGWGSYTYQLINTTTGDVKQAYSANSIIKGLDAGIYDVTIKDVNNCTHTESFTLDGGTPLVATIAPPVLNQCEGDFGASITVTNVTGGQLQDTAANNYSYILTYVSNGLEVSQLSNVFDNLSAGNYTIRVVDNRYSCVSPVYPITIVDPIEVIASANITTDITCSVPTATVTVSGAGGTGPYEFSADGINFSPVNIFNNITAGPHSFYVKDDKGCISDQTTVTVATYETLEATLNVISGFITCKDDSNGVLSADVVGGFNNYEYQLEGTNEAGTAITIPWQASNTFSNLNVGSYQINIRSTNRFGVICYVITDPYDIKEPDLLDGTTVVTQQVSCFGTNTGIITALGIGGNGDYEYNLVSVPANPLYPENKFTDNGVFENLYAGIYQVTIRDVKGCTILTPFEVEIVEPDPLEISLVNVVEQVCLNDPTPTITVNVQGGTAPYYISINNLELPIPYNQNQITLGSSEFINGGTTYVIGVRGTGSDCPSELLSQLTTSTPIDLQLTVDFEYTCETGNFIKAIVDEKFTNEVSYTLYDDNNVAVITNTSGEFINVAAGDGYVVRATHIATLCSEDSNDNPENYIPEILDIKELSMTIDDSEKNKITINADFGLEPYEYSIDGSDFGSEKEFTILQTKDYKITVRDARGCEVTLNIRGTYVSIKVLNLFTPDGDGINDYWYPLDVENYHNIRVHIYDRYARKIANYNGFVQGWDGTYDGNPLPAGDYWYTIYYNELSGEEKKLMGHFTLYR
ncbi:T9SS type B sorting domain-containing protein [Tenacibaculum pacificus]|uniref:T9SS type B sorting domain-containing protein n=1 Tax=Tenacibaculum pacificus TaxID=3018314 RepID=UPI0022F3FDDA|nr:T9SS type B sorting domain-containing protein [Tenacibaculum pacificus]WBX72608.1 T9SS type B sorting domain-containing protein [Tenacibaculum pacificus]